MSTVEFFLTSLLLHVSSPNEIIVLKELQVSLFGHQSLHCLSWLFVMRVWAANSVWSLLDLVVIIKVIVYLTYRSYPSFLVQHMTFDM